jgi:acetyl-CoA acetyltransferase
MVWPAGLPLEPAERRGAAVTPEVAITGVGETAYSRSAPQSVPALAAEAFLKAVEDAGISPQAVDGVIPIGAQVTADDLMSCLGLNLRFVASSPLGGAAAVADLRLAAQAIASDAASHVAVIIAHRNSSATPIADRARFLPGQQFRQHLEWPHGWESPAHWYAMICRRHMCEYGTSKSQLGAVALTMRAHAQLNPHAMMYGRPLTAAEYHSAQPIAEPYGLFDCCLETDGAAAVILEMAPPGRARRRHARLLAVAAGRPSTPDDLTNRPDWFTIGLTHAAAEAFEMAGVGPRDIDIAMIYDCFTFEVIHQLEEAGFFPRGEAAPSIAAGAIRLDGSLPVNPHGGLLSEGHLGGLNHVIEAVRQLRGEGGARQVADPRFVAVTGWGGLGDGAMAILTTEAAA